MQSENATYINGSRLLERFHIGEDAPARVVWRAAPDCLHEDKGEIHGRTRYRQMPGDAWREHRERHLRDALVAEGLSESEVFREFVEPVPSRFRY